jgi:hypothetical protein
MYGRTNIKGMHAVILRRSSSPKQGTSIANQGRTVEAVIAENHLAVIKEYILEGVTGSIPGNRNDIDDVIDQKKLLGLKTLLLLVPDHTRFTRAGAGHGGHLLYRLRANGILVYFVAEDLLVESDLTLQMALMLLAAAHQTAKSIARSSTIGTDNSFLNGKSPYTRIPPLGLDRMYFENGVPLHIIRNLPDGTQEMRDPDTHEVIRRFGKNPKRGVPAHYIKQKNETVALCPGAPEVIAKLHLLFQMRYVKQMKYRRIALTLNKESITSATGGEWSAATVRAILLNPIYIGLAVRYRTTRGIYVQGGSPNGEPEPSEVTPEELDQQSKIKTRRRKREKWKELPVESFGDFLSDDVRDAARAATRAHLDAIADAQPLRKVNRDPHTNSLYILKNILFCKHTGHPMTGRLRGKKGRQVRKYGVSKGQHIPREGMSTKEVLAEPIEQAVVSLVREVILSRPKLTESMQAVVVRAQKQQHAQPDDIAAMEKQVRRLRKQIAVLSDLVSDDDEHDQSDPIIQKIEHAKQEIVRLNTTMRMAGAAPAPRNNDPQVAIEQLVDELEAFGRRIDLSDVPTITAVVQLLVQRIDVDRHTKEFDVTLAIPSWLGHILQHPLPAGLDLLSAYKPQIKAHPENMEILAYLACDATGKPVCYTCRRGQRAD